MPDNKKPIAYRAVSGGGPLDLVGPLTVLTDLKLGSPNRTVKLTSSIGLARSHAW